MTIDPDRSRTDLARGWWRQAGIADERIKVVTAPALDAFAGADPALAGPFDLAFIDALKPEYGAYLEALVGRLAPGALVLADNVLWSGRVSGARPVAADDRNANASELRQGRPVGSALHCHDPAGRGWPAHRRLARLTCCCRASGSGFGFLPSSASSREPVKSLSSCPMVRTSRRPGGRSSRDTRSSLPVAPRCASRATASTRTRQRSWPTATRWQ